MTRRQQEALAALKEHGKMTADAVREQGFAVATFDALVEQGVIQAEQRFTRLGAWQIIYRPSDADIMRRWRTHQFVIPHIPFKRRDEPDA